MSVGFHFLGVLNSQASHSDTVTASKDAVMSRKQTHMKPVCRF